MRIILLFILASVNISQAQSLQGAWRLESISRNEHTLVFYDRAKDAADGYPPVFWKFDAANVAITGDLSVPATDPHALDTVEAHHYALNGDTLVLTQYFTKGLELATITNSEKAYYRLENVSADELTLILYDRFYDGSFRPIDKYSRRYVFSRSR